MSGDIAVVKIGGSVLTGPDAFERTSQWLTLRRHARPTERIVAVVSAESGVTDSLLARARSIVDEPDPVTLDLLWSTGEIRSAALLALSLQACGVNAVAINVHQTGILEPCSEAGARGSRLMPLRLLALLARHDVIVAPGFLARGRGDALVSLGRGGSDLTAVLLAAGLGASRCELVKDVPGYFTTDPKKDSGARPLERLSYRSALAMADEGCDLVQRRAIEVARAHALPLVVAAIGQSQSTLIHDAAC